MKRTILKIKNNKGPVPYGAESSRSGFVILFAVMVSSIVLAIALGVIDISLSEINFGTSAKDTNEALFAADTGVECALYYDNQSPSAFGNSTNGAGNDSNGVATSCAGTGFDISSAGTSWTIVVPYLGSAKKSCAIVKVTKDPSLTPVNTIISKGYNTGGSSGVCTPASNSVERSLRVSY
jgi:hypothetical protein